ncbi:MAG TPA: GntR family transcriptional regulator [Polyangia bacterium]|nr:GntR family transcriptional regulator [Polyangia bacterium]
MAPVLRIDLASPVPAYRQIANALRALLVAGEFSPGDQLPTVRELALDLGVHHNTVAEAYRILSDERWLDLRRRRGVMVLERAMPRAHPDVGAGFKRRLQELVAEARAGGVSQHELAGELRQIAAQLAKEKGS